MRGQREVFVCSEQVAGTAETLLDAMASAGAELVAVSPDVMASLAEREAAEGLVATFDLFETSLDELRLGAQTLVLVLGPPARPR